MCLHVVYQIKISINKNQSISVYALKPKCFFFFFVFTMLQQLLTSLPHLSLHINIIFPSFWHLYPPLYPPLPPTPSADPRDPAKGDAGTRMTSQGCYECKQFVERE